MDWRRYPSFTAEELACKHCHECNMDPDFMMMLQSLRGALDLPLPVTSGWRCPAHNDAVGGGPAHPQGKAADIAVSDGHFAYELVKLALLHGFTGIGILSHGDKRFIHLDMLDPKLYPIRKALWTYP